MTISAYVCPSPGAVLEEQEIEPDRLEPLSVRVAVDHCGICHSDVHLIDGDWGTDQFPMTAGHEVIGHIVEAGTDVDESRIGQRVGIGWKAYSCFECARCEDGNEQLCDHGKATAVGHIGGFAEETVVHEKWAIPVPDELDSETTAPLMCGGLTVFSPLRRFAAAGHQVGIVGVGGLGHMALQFAKAMGAGVYALSTNDSKEAQARKFGADHFFNTSSGDFESLREQLDMLLVTTHVSMDWMNFLRTIRPGGTMCFVGAIEGTLPFTVDTLLDTQVRITGSATGGVADANDMLQFASHHKIAAAVEPMPFEKINDGISRVRANEARYRVVLNRRH